MAKEHESVLCSVGLRGNDGHVLEKALALANATGADMHVLHVIKPLSGDVLNTLKINIRDREALEAMMQQRIRERREKLTENVDAACQQYPPLKKAMEEGRIVNTVLEGHPASVIAHFASQENISMIVMAANKQHQMASYAGKVTKGVIKRARVPVVVMPNAS
ncbi:universal stress protein [Halomonas piscis]|uniref:Universal stress protein n=1 Tax=Halomonas piscis TaxID=3031727 RepID=A0ABY9YYI1_9GAMM|nr:universal stress protein [Halomonas piscis]WNK19891.1 universal stress protein [Halomonas piscis]